MFTSKKAHVVWETMTSCQEIMKIYMDSMPNYIKEAAYTLCTAANKLFDDYYIKSKK